MSGELIDYVLRYGGRCRDCADNDGTCPSSGLPCGGGRKAVEHVIEAIAYGVGNGFLRTDQFPESLRAELSALRGEEEWCPRIGEEVRVSESFLELYGEWRDIPLWVTGVYQERDVAGINVTVTEQWPLDRRTDGDTDGFYIGRTHSPDCLVPVKRPTSLTDTAAQRQSVSPQGDGGLAPTEARS